MFSLKTAVALSLMAFPVYAAELPDARCVNQVTQFDRDDCFAVGYELFAKTQAIHKEAHSPEFLKKLHEEEQAELHARIQRQQDYDQAMHNLAHMNDNKVWEK